MPGSLVRFSISFFCVSAAWIVACSADFSSFSLSIASSTRRRSLAAAASSLRGTDTTRVSTEPISSPAVALPSTRIEAATASAGRSANSSVCSPFSSLMRAVRTTSAPAG